MNKLTLNDPATLIASRWFQGGYKKAHKLCFCTNQKDCWKTTISCPIQLQKKSNAIEKHMGLLGYDLLSQTICYNQTIWLIFETWNNSILVSVMHRLLAVPTSVIKPVLNGSFLPGKFRQTLPGVCKVGELFAINR